MAVGALAGLPRMLRAESREHDHGVFPASSRGDQQTESQDSTVAKLNNPSTAGRPRARVSSYDNDPFVISIEERVKCNCGCAHSLYQCRTTDFVCGFWQPLHAEVVSMVQQEMNADEIVAAYVSKYGQQYLMAPPTRGFNLAGYFLPGVAISLVAAGMLWVLRRRSLMPATVATAVPTAAAGGEPELTDEELARLDDELRELDV
jgi:cytochrome c-type biogenesis protein CcmH